MADNTTLDPGTGGDTIATDDIAGVKHQRVKIEIGADGSASDVHSGNPLPVSDAGGTLSVDDGAGSLTVDGTVTANAGTGTFTVDQADTATADYDSGAGTVNQTMLGLALPASGGPVAGGTSSAPVRTDPTGTTAQPVTDNGGSLTVDGTVTAVASGDHTVVGKAADGAAVSGNPVLVAGQDGTNAQSLSTNASGHLNIADGGNSITVDGTVTVQDGGNVLSVDDNGASLTVDGTVTANAGTGDFSVVGKAADGAAVAGNPVLVAGQDGTNAQSLSTNSSGHVNIADGGNSITVDGTVGVSGTVTVDTEMAAAAAAADNTANPTAPIVQAFLSCFDGSTWDRAPGDSTNGIDVDVTRLPSGTVAGSSSLPAGTNNIGDVDVLTLPALPAGTNNIGQVDPRGNVAHDAADSGNPIKVGTRARTALPTAVAQDDRADAVSDKFGRQLVANAPLDQRANGRANYTNTTAADVIAAPGASIAVVVTTVLVTNAHATVGTKVELRDGTTVKLIGQASKDGGGFNLHDPDGLFIATANTAVTARCVTTGADVEVFVAGFKIPA